jgi:hypothetical protein
MRLTVDRTGPDRLFGPVAPTFARFIGAIPSFRWSEDQTSGCSSAPLLESALQGAQ